MIVFDLQCREGKHRFEGWFGSTGDYEAQQQRGLVACPDCGSTDVIKAPMAANIARKGNQLPVVAPSAPAPGPAGAPPQMMSKAAMPPEAAAMMRALADLQAKAIAKSRWVGESFAEESRRMHYGESEAEPIHGQASLSEAQDLLEEGIEVAPLLFPVAPPGEAN